MKAEEVAANSIAWYENQYEHVIAAIKADGQKGLYPCIRYSNGHALSVETIDRLIADGYSVRETKPLVGQPEHDSYYHICWSTEELDKISRQESTMRYLKSESNYNRGYRDGLKARPWFIRFLSRVK